MAAKRIVSPTGSIIRLPSTCNQRVRNHDPSGAITISFYIEIQERYKSKFIRQILKHPLPHQIIKLP
jgi:hypothetical protein